MARALASFLVLVVAACGSSSASTPTSTSNPTSHATPSPSGTSTPPSSPTPTPPQTPTVDAGADAAASPSPACLTSSVWSPGDEKTMTLDRDGGAREYVVHVGSSVPAGTPVPLLVNVHGLTNSPQIQEAFSGMNAIADAKGFVVVYPQGEQASFNAGPGCCGYAEQSGVDDVGFVRALVADAESKACIDAKRVYATGFSNGGYMAHTLACVASDLFAAIAPVSGANVAMPCDPPRAIPVIEFHGDADPIVPYADGHESASGWATRDHCAGSSTRTAYGASYCDEWDGCDGGAKVRFCTIAGGSHLWPGQGAAIVASPMIWDFLASFSMAP